MAETHATDTIAEASYPLHHPTADHCVIDGLHDQARLMGTHGLRDIRRFAARYGQERARGTVTGMGALHRLLAGALLTHARTAGDPDGRLHLGIHARTHAATDELQDDQLRQGGSACTRPLPARGYTTGDIDELLQWTLSALEDRCFIAPLRRP